MRLPALAAAILLTSACTPPDAEDDQATNAEASTTTEAPEVAAAPASGDPTPVEGAQYVAMAGAGDLYEIQSSQLALEKSESSDVRQFAQMMIDNHQATTQQVTEAARQAGLDPAPPQLMPMQTQMLSELRPLSGADFDQAYVRQQRQAHDMALSLQRNYAANGDTPELQQAASGAVPIIERHIAELQRLLG